MMKELKLPVGIESFEEIRKEGFYYVDKTKLIEQLLDNLGKSNLFTRPRRFGKTLNMSMLKYFFQIGTDPHLFDGLYIAKRKDLCEGYMGKYPVIFLSLKSIEATSFEMAQKQFVKLIGNEARRFSFLMNSDNLSNSEKEDFDALLDKQNGLYTMNEDLLISSLQTLSELLYKHYNQKTIILIDEYDVPLDKAFHNGYYTEMVSLLRGFLGNALKTNDALQFAVLTGCLRISKESIFTGLNNFKVLTITDARFDEQFGFTKEEVKELLSYYKKEEYLQAAKEWYDGYHFGNTDVYCPWDVINYVDLIRFNTNAMPQAFWLNTSSNSLVKRLIAHANYQTRKEIERLISGDTIQKKIHQELTYDEIDKSTENLWSVLFSTGYLTIEKEVALNTYELKIPNKEVLTVYVEQIQEWAKESLKNSKVELQQFYFDLENGNTEGIEKFLNQKLDQTISVFDTRRINGEKENSYHMFLNGILSVNENWYVRSNVESGDGFADIMIEMQGNNSGIIIEVKHCDAYDKLESSSQEALQQIKEKRYDTYLKNEGRVDILAYGISFFKKRCKVVAERLK